jgi:hypothetical protein
MTAQPSGGTPPTPITSLEDPRAIQILSTEHWSLLTSRSLAYNEAFVRGGMFLTFLSTSFVALALLAQAMSFGADFLTIAAIILAFDLVIGLATFGRIVGANADDLRAVHGMARIRHAYTHAAPLVTPYFTTATHDDMEAILTAYGIGPTTLAANFFYALTTSGGMIGLITSMVGGVLAGILALMLGASGGLSVWIGVGGAVLVLGGVFMYASGRVVRNQAGLATMFPSPQQAGGTDGDTRA